MTIGQELYRMTCIVKHLQHMDAKEKKRVLEFMVAHFCRIPWVSIPPIKDQP